MANAIYFFTKNDPYFEFSNFAPYGLEADGLYWPTVEHYFQAQKFIGEAHAAYRERIRAAHSPQQAKTLGQSRAVPLRPDWEAVKEDVMRHALRQKFANPTLRELLLSTKRRPLIENSPFDRYWGIGKDGQGKNRLGALLMELRDQLARGDDGATAALSLDEVKQKVAAITPALALAPFVVLHTFERNGQELKLALTERFYRACRKGKLWQSPAVLTALKNAEYGFDPQLARSRGGRDGIFLVDRSFKPKNAMITKLFDRYLDTPQQGAAQLASALGTAVESLQAVRLVSHHLRLLGVLWRDTNADWLVLVDYDDTK